MAAVFLNYLPNNGKPQSGSACRRSKQRFKSTHDSLVIHSDSVVLNFYMYSVIGK